MENKRQNRSAIKSDSLAKDHPLGSGKNEGVDCIERILARRSIRKFKEEPISDEVRQSILEAGRLAPTATNSQPWHFILARQQEAKEAFSFGGFNRFVGDADFIVLGLYRSSEVIIEKLSLMDVTIALQSMVITAWIQGVGSCWMGAFDEPRLRKILDLPADSRLIGAIAFGIPDEKPPQPQKRTIGEIVHFDKW
jgi:nitroreductase